MAATSYGIPTPQESTPAERYRKIGIVLGGASLALSVVLLVLGVLEQPNVVRLQAALATGMRTPAKKAIPLVRKDFVPMKSDSVKARPRPAVVLAKWETEEAQPVVRFASSTAEPGSGLASYYGSELAGRRTASGEPFRPTAYTAAHRTLPFGTLVRVTNVRNGRSVVVRINDRGPFSRARVIDLSKAAAREIGMVGAGTARVRIDVVQRN